MKKYGFVLLLPFIVLALNSCQKISGTELVGVNSGTSSSATYQPLTTGSTWKYRTDYSATFGYTYVDTDVITMSSKTLTINGKLYNAAYENNLSYGIADTAYYYAAGNTYSLMQKVSLSATSSYTVELLYLKDNVPVGTTWTSSLTYPGLGNTVLNGKITEKGISKIVAGKTFSNVIHSTVSLTMNVSGSPFVVSYEIYTAQGVGVVHIDLNESGYATVPEDLISYTIK